MFILTSTVASTVYSADNKYCRYIYLLIEGAMTLTFSFTTPSSDVEKSCSYFIVTDQEKLAEEAGNTTTPKKQKILKQENRIGEAAE